MSERKTRILGVMDSPNGNTSYGHLARMMIEDTHEKYNWHVCDLQYPQGKPINNNKYVRWFSMVKGDRDPTALPLLINKIKPNLIFSNSDVQHQGHVNRYLPQGLPWCGWLPWDSVDRNSASRVNALTHKMDTRVALAKFAQEFLESCGVDVHAQIYNCINDKQYFPLRPNDPAIIDFKTKNANWLPQDKKILLFVGRPNWRKRMSHLLAIIQELVVFRKRKDIILFMHTDMKDPASIFNLYELVHAMRLEGHVMSTPENIWFVGVDEALLRVLYNVADIYISAQAGEGFGMPVAESMACGTPFVTTDFTTAREMAGEKDERGLCAKFDRTYVDRGVHRPLPNVVDFADKIEYLLDNPSVLKKKGRAGPYWVKNNCTRKIVHEAWEKIFNQYDVNYANVVGYKENGVV